MTQLMTHNPKVKAEKMSLTQLRDLPRPVALSKLHNPIPHHLFLAAIESRIKDHFDATIEEREIAVGRGANFQEVIGIDPANEKWAKHAALFAVLKLSKKGVAGTRYSIGIRTANDRSMSHQLVAGLNVFVCDNMVFRGDTIVMKEKHLKSMDLGVQLEEGLKTIKDKFSLLTGGIEQLREQKITDDRGYRIIYESQYKKFGPQLNETLLPAPKFFEMVGKEWAKPSHDEFRPRNMWSLNNCYTEVMKQLPDHLRMRRIQYLGEMFGLGETTKEAEETPVAVEN